MSKTILRREGRNGDMGGDSGSGSSGSFAESSSMEFKSSDGTKIIFSSQHQDEEVFHDRDLIQLFPFGVSLNGDSSRPFLLLKDSAHEYTLPVALNALEAGVTLTQSTKNQLPLTPHKFSQVLMQSLDIQIVRCVFVQIKGRHQYVRLYMMGHPKTNSLKVRADEAMSLCLHLNVPIFATKSFINQSRIMTAEAEGLKRGLKQNFAVFSKAHPYVM